MLVEDTYQTVSKEAEGLFKDKGSKFISYIYPIKTDDDVKILIAELKKKHPTARHFCYAYKIGITNDNFRINDDGEPSGTAGRPIYNQILSYRLTNVIIVVVRYFGGTQLGVPGLIQAYKEASKNVIDQSEIITKIIYDGYTLTFDYVRFNEVMKVIRDNNLKIKSQHVDNLCIIIIEIRKSILEMTLGKLAKIDSLQHQYLYTD